MYKEKYSDNNSQNLLSKKMTEGIKGLKSINSGEELQSNIW